MALSIESVASPIPESPLRFSSRSQLPPSKAWRSVESLPRNRQKDNAKDLLDATKRWKPWLPPKSDQGLQQGGAFVFDGAELLLGHYDPSTGAHVKLDEVLRVALAK